MYGLTETLARDRIGRLRAEAGNDSHGHAWAGPSGVSSHAGAPVGAWWRRLMGMPLAAPGHRPATGRIA
jgi:hypothetical protein